ncbi:MAG: hypothetical protein COZ46_03230 [Verrucomicrobia bacterium CG_4_10_14_3_um_filter_43_23]|nr:MAG: hypothetical protein AUJ82_00655 [Verrucomicrobia bacterium CG1_02_43_26]PIP59218.1 MAG: hypothetical protein COX01_04280 [Verrucomicrobia bacterium CG22_combo_CG10-13_8_21_14_all_43_17]PIX58598.1 MAG: hypothetical protein COZ46_03230 [Verrucomicrobia bacterium CG_4_10_14_3_um_filter_43_23]PIY61050.1 MAG: hypothetical protein COY94_07550 [Verrucomicrobia bacterium CG_4_10_14_0_8_um_filter_43_34]PJA43891.1 MAG: hypothetical protein CO175_05920 [Verrucomicrobia bacterium CG_4_9_14_3_um_fi
MQRRKKKKLGIKGFSLVEVMVSMIIFGIAALGLSATAIQSQKIAQMNIIRNTAFTVAQGYLEQMKSIAMAELLSSVSNNSQAIPTKSISALETANIEKDDPLYLGKTTETYAKTEANNYKQVLIDIQEDTDGNPVEYTVDMWFTPKIKDLNTGANAIPALEIILEFEYEARHVRGDVKHQGSLRMVKTEL